MHYIFQRDDHFTTTLEVHDNEWHVNILIVLVSNHYLDEKTLLPAWDSLFGDSLNQFRKAHGQALLSLLWREEEGVEHARALADHANI